ncbi:MAG TPA: methyltransferase domain-containing protein [Gemmatimonadales bacterium]|nr:methyltransferase domain-containing protein [Gemmatimonadales bacterium]
MSLVITPLGHELLDDPAADPAIAAASLRNIARANRWFGNTWLIAAALRDLIGTVPPGTELTLLDLGTGVGDLPRFAVRWAGRRRIIIRPVGLELNRVAASMAHTAGVPTMVACAGTPPLRPHSVDLVLVSQLLHHLTPESAVGLLRTCKRLARRGVVISELRRSPLARLAFRTGSAVLRFDPATRHDGLLSIRRGYTATELTALLAEAGMPARARGRAPFRLVAAWRRGAG